MAKEMRRVFYMGREAIHDARLGLDLYPGYAFDCPSPMAEALLKEPCFRSTRQGSYVDERPMMEVTWYSAPPGEELLALDGIGKGRAALLMELGINFLDDLIALDEVGIVALAADLPAIGRDQVNAWIDQAKKIKEAI